MSFFLCLSQLLLCSILLKEILVHFRSDEFFLESRRTYDRWEVGRWKEEERSDEEEEVRRR